MLMVKACCCLLMFVVVCRGDTFTSIREMERLFDMEQNLVVALNNYLRHVDFEMELMDLHYSDLKKIESEIQDVDAYAANPVNAYSVAKRMIKEWPSTFKLMEGSPFFEEDTDLPDKTFLTEMTAALVQWQKSTNTKTEAIARGWVDGVKPHANMTAGDCYDIAVYCYNIKETKLAVEWLKEALVKITDKRDYSASLVEVLEYTFLAKCLTGDVEGSATALKSLLNEGSHWYTPADELKSDYKLPEVQKCKAAAEKSNKKTTTYFKGYDTNNELCLGNTKSIEKEAQCYLIDFGNPFLVLGPSRVEYLSFDPIVFMVHDVVGHDDILDIKESSLKELKKLTMENNGPVKLPNVKLNERFNERIANRTSLGQQIMFEDNLVTLSGPRSVAKTFNDDFKLKEEKNEIVYAKMVYFLNDVPKGGYTVFPKIKLAVEPKKGAALVWLNPKLFGREDDLMQRVECPVLVGAKWAMTQTAIDTTEQ